ncbi:MAG: SDR family NAD(P)-dependent oxidoreductase [Ruminococcaceae bacterium]|nr:SDR family NAD(P)-dependent oxidoreductase [Oscillospiraceae bacterium]
MAIAIITGASAGLGDAFYRAVRRRHPELDGIWLIARRKERLEEMAKDCPYPVTVLPLDLTREDGYAALQQKLEEEKPQVAVLINNAGMGKLGNVADSDVHTQCYMIDLNCRGLTAVTTAVLPYMQEKGYIINVASIAAFAPNARLTVYSSTKAYVLSFSKGLREELKPRHINVLAVCPGPMDTEFLAVADITGNSKTFQRLPYCNPEKVARHSVEAAIAGRASYTPRLFFKFYRVLAKLLPHNVIIPLCKT